MSELAEEILLTEPVVTKTVMIALLGERKFAVLLNEAKGVAPPTRPTRIPGTREAISGLIYFRGGIEVSLDLGVIWNGRASQFDRRAKGILVEAEGIRAVLIVDQLLGSYDTPETAIPNGNSSDFALIGQNGVIEWNSERIPFISIPALLNSISNSPT